MNTHERYMSRCLELAVKGAGQVAPNPMVGAVLVHKDSIIAEGYHRFYGQAHAEVNCINNLPESLHHCLQESTLYVSLEPCSHFGKTPPCTDLIINSRIPRVVIACSDPFEKVKGSGIRQLSLAGVKLVTGVLEKEAIEINKRFFTFHQQKRPYVLLKWAQSSDRFIALTDSTAVRISNDFSNRLVHKWRSEESAIMVGTKTALHDNPSLTTRLWPGKNPVRIVLDLPLTLPFSLSLFDRNVDTVVVNAMRQQEDGNLLYYKTGGKDEVIQSVLTMMRERNLVSLIVEGGTGLISSFIESGIWDEARVITNKGMKIGNGIKAPELGNRIPVSFEHYQEDEISFYRNMH